MRSVVALSATKMGNSRSSQALQEENISQIEADTGCKCINMISKQNINFANDLDYLLTRLTSLIHASFLPSKWNL